jgi:hypothetical protein
VKPMARLVGDIREVTMNAVHRWPRNIYLHFHFVVFCGYVSNGIFFGC